MSVNLAEDIMSVNFISVFCYDKQKSWKHYSDLIFVKMMLYPFFYSFNKMLIYYVRYTMIVFLSLDLNFKRIKERLYLIEQKDGLNLFSNSFPVHRTG